jgi:hypothetical protein
VEPAPAAPVELAAADRGLYPGLAVFLAAAVLFGYAHFGIQGVLERDGYYHARLSQMLPERGLSREFPWMQYATWKDQFVDKDFLFHVALVPFCLDAHEPLVGAQFFMTLLAACIFLAVYIVSRRQGVPWPWFFALLLIGIAPLFLSRMVMVRSHVLSVLLLLIGLDLLVRGAWRGLFVLGFIYAWSYTVPFVLFLTAAPFCLGQGLLSGKWDWRSPLASFGGAFLGLLIHPYSPATLEIVWTVLEVFLFGLAGREQGQLEVGQEIYGLTTERFLRANGVWIAVILAISLLSVMRRKRLRPETWGLLAAAWAWFVVSIFSFRFVEYGAPLGALAAGFVARDVFRPAPETDAGEVLVPPAPPHLAPAWKITALVCLTVSVVFSTLFFLHVHRQGQPPRFYRAAAWLQENATPGETVATLWWDDFPELYYYAPTQYYLVGLDPNLMRRRHPDLLEKLERMRKGQEPLDAVWLAEAFGARYLAVRTDAATKFYPELDARYWQPVYGDATARIYALTGPEGPPPGWAGVPSKRDQP